MARPFFHASTTKSSAQRFNHLALTLLAETPGGSSATAIRDDAATVPKATEQTASRRFMGSSFAYSLPTIEEVGCNKSVTGRVDRNLPRRRSADVRTCSRRRGWKECV